MAAGFPPYCGDSAMQTYKLILEGCLEFPSRMGHTIKDIVRRLLHPSVTKRLGCQRGGAADLRNHRWFAELNTQRLLRMKLPTPYKPKVQDEMDTSNFADYEEAPDAPYVDDGSGWDDDF
jgi:serine/threonine protein kinase